MILFFATFSVCSFDVAQLRGTASAASAGVQDDSKAKEEVQKVERDWSAAMSRRDAGTLLALLSDDIRWVENGKVKRKAEIAEGFTKWPKTPPASQPCNEVIDHIDVQIFGDVALATGQYTGTCKKGDTEEKGRTIFADMLVKRQGRWQFVLMTNEPVPEQKGQNKQCNGGCVPNLSGSNWLQEPSPSAPVERDSRAKW
jgi:uncharacterized protein (TIGR02246 family)